MLVLQQRPSASASKPKCLQNLVTEVIRQAAGRSDRLVMVADETYHAGAIYEAMGFRQQGRIASLCQEPRTAQRAPNRSQGRLSRRPGCLLSATLRSSQPQGSFQRLQSRARRHRTGNQPLHFAGTHRHSSRLQLRHRRALHLIAAMATARRPVPAPPGPPVFRTRICFI